MLSPVWLFVTPQTVAHQAPLSLGFSRQEYWSGLPLPPPGDLPDSRTKPASPASPALAGGFSTTEPPGKPTTVFWSSNNEVPQTGWFKQQRFVSWCWKLRNSSSRWVEKGGSAPHASFRLVDDCLLLVPSGYFLYLSVSCSSLYMRAQVILAEAHPDDLILSWLPL